MNGYAKIKLVDITESRSSDLSDFLSSSQNPKLTENTSPTHMSKQQATEQIKGMNSQELEEEESGNGERFGVILRRNRSLSSDAPHKLRIEKQNTRTLQAAVKRAFSMRRSSSVSERYCRIHDKCLTLASPLEDGDGDVQGMDGNPMQTRSMKKKHRTAKILKAYLLIGNNNGF